MGTSLQVFLIAPTLWGTGPLPLKAAGGTGLKHLLALQKPPSCVTVTQPDHYTHPGQTFRPL